MPGCTLARIKDGQPMARADATTDACLVRYRRQIYDHIQKQVRHLTNKSTDNARPLPSRGSRLRKFSGLFTRKNVSGVDDSRRSLSSSLRASLSRRSLSLMPRLSEILLRSYTERRRAHMDVSQVSTAETIEARTAANHSARSSLADLPLSSSAGPSAGT